MKMYHLLPLLTLAMVPVTHAEPAAPSAHAMPCHGLAAHHDGPGHKPGHHAGRHSGAFLERLDQRADLDLSDAQKQKLKALGEEEHARHEAIRKESQARMDKVLTAEQRSKLAAHRQAMQEKRAERLEQRAEHLKDKAERLRDDKSQPR